MSPGWLGCHPSSSRVRALEARLSAARKPAIQVKCSPACSGAMEFTGTSRCLPITAAMSRIGTPSSATACSVDPAGACSSARRNRRAESAPASLASIDAAAAGLEAAGAFLQEGRELAQQRQAIIAASAELQERELIKLASLAAALAEALRQRGVEEPSASLTAEAGIAVFKIAFERWVQETSRQDFPGLIHESLDELRVAVGH